MDEDDALEDEAPGELADMMAEVTVVPGLFLVTSEELVMQGDTGPLMDFTVTGSFIGRAEIARGMGRLAAATG